MEFYIKQESLRCDEFPHIRNECQFSNQLGLDFGYRKHFDEIR